MRLFNQKQKSRVCCKLAATPAVQKGLACPLASPCLAYQVRLQEATYPEALRCPTPLGPRLPRAQASAVGTALTYNLPSAHNMQTKFQHIPCSDLTQDGAPCTTSIPTLAPCARNATQAPPGTIASWQVLGL